MDNTWLLLTAGLVAIILLPAIIAGGGFLIAIPIAIVIVIAALGGPKYWELYKNKSMGAKGRTYDVRDLLGGQQGDAADDVDDLD